MTCAPAISAEGPTTINILLDTASTENFITVSCLNSISHTVLDNNISLSVTSLTEQRTAQAQRVTFHVKINDRSVPICAFTVPHIANTLHFDRSPNFVVPTHLKLNRQLPLQNTSVDVLIGIKLFPIFSNGNTFPLTQELFLMSTAWGWIFCGQSHSQNRPSAALTACHLTTTERLVNILEKIHSLECLPDDNLAGSASREELAASRRLIKILFSTLN